jgi:hypothetical protein
VDFVLMSRMHWSWEELRATPMYVRRYCADIIAMQAEHEQQQERRRQADAKRQAQMR